MLRSLYIIFCYFSREEFLVVKDEWGSFVELLPSLQINVEIISKLFWKTIQYENSSEILSPQPVVE